MSTLAPFSIYMKLGQGFNSYTQETCIEDAVRISSRVAPSPSLSKSRILQPISGNSLNGHSDGISQKDVKAAASDSLPPFEGASNTSASSETPLAAKNMSQIVTYSSRSVSNMTDIVDALDISASASIKYGTVKGSGSASFVNENKVNQSDINYIITVKVTNSMTVYPDEMAFNPLDGMNPKDFTEVFGDCFISGFLEGGEFSAIISIAVNNKSKLQEVKAAAEADLAIAVVPGLSVGASTSTDKKKSDVWNDTETTISVNWSGGGELKDPASKWDLPTVIDVACRFPHLVESSSEKTSAILTKYTSLRSFVAENARLIVKGGKDAGFLIRDYGLCQLYTMDLFSAYMLYKQMWTTISEMMKHMDRYREREKSKHVPDPVQLTPKGLNEARELVRRQMTIITRENARLVTEPNRADDEDVKEPVPYAYPNELLVRLPIRETSISIQEQVDLNIGYQLLTTEELGEVRAIAQWPDFHLNPLSGDVNPTSTSWFKKGKSTLFCTIDTTQDPKVADSLLKLRIHAHEHHHGHIFGDLIEHSKAAEGFPSAIGYSTSRDSNTRACSDGTHHHVGRQNDDHQYWSPLVDLAFSKIASVVVEYLPGSEKLSSLILLDASGNEIVSWKQYEHPKAERPAGLKVDQQRPPEARGWQLAGFWGHCDAIVITRLGAIWKRTDSGAVSMGSANGLANGGLTNGTAAAVE